MSIHAYTYATTKDTGKITLQMALYCIAMHVNVETGKTYVGIKTLMAEAKVRSDRTMRNYIARLEEKGFIRREARKRVNGGRTTNNIELVGFLEWFRAQHHSEVAEAAAKTTGGPQRQNLPGGSGSLDLPGPPVAMATGQDQSSIPELKDQRSVENHDADAKGRRPAHRHRFVSEEALNKVRWIAPGWDRQSLLDKFMKWEGSTKAEDMDKAFLGWVRSYTKGKAAA